MESRRGGGGGRKDRCTSFEIRNARDLRDKIRRAIVRRIAAGATFREALSRHGGTTVATFLPSSFIYRDFSFSLGKNYVPRVVSLAFFSWNMTRRGVTRRRNKSPVSNPRFSRVHDAKRKKVSINNNEK